MKVIIVSVPMKLPDKLKHTSKINISLEYDREVYLPVSCIFAKKIKKDEEVKVIFVKTAGQYSKGEKNKRLFIKEFEEINKDIKAVLSFDVVETDFLPTNQTYNRLITDLADKIPLNSEIYADITFGSKPGLLSLFCALRFAEEFRDAFVEFIVYGKVEFDDEGKKINPEVFDTTSLYYLFKLMGTMGSTDADTASGILKDFFAM